MNIEQLYTSCLAQGAYYIESNGEAAVIDPLRETQQYIDRAAKDGAVIKYIFETHFHADFVSGHVTLSEQTSAPIIYGPTAQTTFESIMATDGQVFKLGKITLTALHTPGHTLESTTYLLKDENGKDHCIFSGDTLFLGDVGRPDLAQKANELTEEDLAGMLYDSLRQQIMPLANDVIVYPAHGAGSACGKNMMKETVDTLGNQKKMNYALREDMTREEFVYELTYGLEAPLAYFSLNVKMNKEGYKNLDDVIKTGSVALSPAEFENIANTTDAVILDVRGAQEFAQGHIPNSIFIGIDGGFAPWVGALVQDTEQHMLLVTPEGRVEETMIRLSRVGFDNTIGYLKGGFQAWKDENREVETVVSIPALQFATDVTDAGYTLPIYDVRKRTEFELGHVKGANLASLATLHKSLKSLSEEATFYVHCAGGYRSMIAASILKNRGIHNFIEVQGGYGAIKNEDINLE
jgi:glyoxylase-like metal-dependent hydrolase (beta-lactamase superfamily II)/rhodanese-related sulfurtransferase